MLFQEIKPLKIYSIRANNQRHRKEKKIFRGGGLFKGKYSPTSKLYQTYLLNVGKYYVFEKEIKIFKIKMH